MTDGNLTPADLSRLLDPERLAALRTTTLLDSPPEEAFDRLTRLATRVLDVPVSLVTLVDERREFWKSCVGVTGPGAEARESPLERSFCKYVVISAEPLVVDDAREHPLLRENAAVTEGGVVAYAGIPLVTREGHALGSLCAIDFQPRAWSDHDVAVLQDLAAAVMTEVEVRTEAARVEQERAERAALLDSALEGVYGMDWEGRCTFINRAGAEMLGYAQEELLGRNMHEAVHHTRLDGTPHPIDECPIMRACMQGASSRADADVFWRKNGVFVRVEYACGPLMREGEQVGGVVTFRDITERRTAEEQRRASERRAERTAERMRSVAEAATGVIGARSLEELDAVLRATAGRVLPHDVLTFGTYDPAEHALHFVAGWDGEVWEPAATIPLAGKPSERVVRERTSLLTHRSGEPAAIGAEHFGRAPRSESVIRSPILSGERVLGVLSVQSYTPGLYAAEDVEVLEAFAAVIASAIRNIELLEDRERAAAAVQASEERYRALAQNATEAIVTIDAEDRIVLANPAAERIFGYSAEELGAMRFTALLPERRREEHRAGIRRYLDTNQRRIAWTGIELPGLHRDGREIRLDVTFSEYAQDGRRFFTGVMRDITLRREAEERAMAAVRESEARYRSVFEGAAEGMFLIDRGQDGAFRYVDVNPALERIGGLRRDEFVGRGPGDILPPDAAARIAALYARVFETGMPAEVEHTNQLPRGQVSTRTRYYPLRDSAGQVVRVLGITEDVTARTRAEEALRESEERFRQLADSVPDVFWVTDVAEQRVLYVSPAWERVWGFPAERVYEDAHSFTVAIHPEDRARAVARMDEMTRGPVDGVEYRIVRPDGEVRWISTRGAPVRDGEGQIRRVAGISQDVTERKRVEAALQDSEARYRGLFQEVPVGLYRTTPDGRFLDANLALVDILGFPDRETLLAAPVPSLYVDPTDRLRWREELRRTGIVKDFDVRIRRRDGALIWIRHTAQAHPDADGNLVHYEGVVEDITERRLAEEALRESETRLSQILEAMPAGVFMVDASGVPQFANARAHEILGGASEAAAGAEDLARVFRAYVAGTDELYPGERMPIVRALAGEAAIVDDMEIRRPNRVVPLHVEGAPIRDTEGRIVGGVATFVDMAETRKLEEQLRQATKMEAVGRLAGGVAHDFNNLLTAISGNTELLLADTPEGHPAREDLEEIRRAAARAADLTRQMLAFSRQQVIQPQELRLNEVVSGMQRMLGRLLGEDIELVVSEGASVGPVLADRTQMDQVVLNLAVNARDAMPDGGVLRIHTANARLTEADRRSYSYVVPGDYVLLEVGDTGHGIAPDVLEHIFEPFYTTKEQGKGTGLGLAMVYGTVKQANGYIWAESDPGSGTRFRIYLPRLNRAAGVDGGATAAGTAPDAVSQPQIKGTVLLVEDQDAVRRLAARILRRAGYTVLEAAEGREALATLDEAGGSIDLLLTDVVMPGANGRELARAVAACCPGVRTLFMSGHTEDEVVRRGIHDESVEFIHKPFTPVELIQKVAEVLGDDPLA